MAKIKFTENETIFNVAIKRIYSNEYNRIQLIFDNDIPEYFPCDFVEINEHNTDFVQAEYTGYNYIYKRIDNKNFILTNNSEDVYTEPEIIESTEKVYTPTLEDVKKSKIDSLSSICEDEIVKGVDVLIDNVIEHFSYRAEDQTNIKELFDLVIQTNEPIYYHADGMGLKLYTVSQIGNIYSSNIMNKNHHTAYFNQLKMYITSLQTIEEVESTEYGQELIGEYLEIYENAMSQARIAIHALLET